MCFAVTVLCGHMDGTWMPPQCLCDQSWASHNGSGNPPPLSLTFISIFHTQLSMHTQIKAWLYLTCYLKHTEFMGKTSVSEWESVTFSGFHTGNILVYNVCSSSNSWKKTKCKLETTNVILLNAANLKVQHTLQAAVVKLAWQQSSNGAMKQSRFLSPGMCSVCCGHNQEN